MRIGILGLGGISASHVAAWQVLGEELAAYDPDPKRPAPAGVTRHGSVESLVAGADVVDICTPSYTHANLIRRVADLGRPMIVEKPIALTVDDAVAAVRHCRDRGVELVVGQVVRYFAEYEAAHRAFATGAYGEPAVLRFRRASAQPRTNGWMHRDELSGGIAVDLMIHDLDQALWFAGPVATVYAAAALPRYGGALTHCYATLEHASGALTQVTASWALAGGFETSFEIAGTEGMIAHDSTDHPSLRADRTDLLAVPGLLPAMDGVRPFVAELGELAAALVSGAPARVGAADAVAALSVAVAAATSVRTGAVQRPQPLPGDLQPTATQWSALAGATW